MAHRARQMLRVVRRWLPSTGLTLLGDTTYSVIDLGRWCQKPQARLIAPLWCKARLRQAPAGAITRQA